MNRPTSDDSIDDTQEEIFHGALFDVKKDTVLFDLQDFLPTDGLCLDLEYISEEAFYNFTSESNSRKRLRDEDPPPVASIKCTDVADQSVYQQFPSVINELCDDVNRNSSFSSSNGSSFPLESNDDIPLNALNISSRSSGPHGIRRSPTPGTSFISNSKDIPKMAVGSVGMSDLFLVLARFCGFLRTAIINSYPSRNQPNSQLKLHHDHPLLVDTDDGRYSAVIIDSLTFNNWGSFILLSSIVSHYTGKFSSYSKHNRRSFVSSLVFSIAAGTQVSDCENRADVALAVNRVLDPRCLISSPSSSTSTSIIAGRTFSMSLGEYFRGLCQYFEGKEKSQSKKQIFLVITCVETLLSYCYRINDTITRYPGEKCYDSMRGRLASLVNVLTSLEENGVVYRFDDICRQAVVKAKAHYDNMFENGRNPNRILTQSITIMSQKSFQSLFKRSDAEYQLLKETIKTRHQQSDNLASSSTIKNLVAVTSAEGTITYLDTLEEDDQHYDESLTIAVSRRHILLRVPIPVAATILAVRTNLRTEVACYDGDLL